MKGFKATDNEGKCRKMLFEVGKTYNQPGDLKICLNGFHFCEKLMDVYNYYEKSELTRIFEVEALGEVQNEGDKSCTNEIKILRELSTAEILKAWINKNNSGDSNSGYFNSGYFNSGNYNSGHYNSGNYNSGNYNSGNYNSGYFNSGNYNSGDSNSGYYNSGNYNSGNYNSGYFNSGYFNSGNYNSGHYNSGDSNSGHYNSGFFNTNTPFVRLFNKKTKLRFDDPIIQKIRNISYKIKPILQWVYQDNMTEQEKADFPTYKITGGYLKKTNRNDYSAWKNKEDLDFLKSLPNFDAEIFKEITGIEVELP